MPKTVFPEPSGAFFAEAGSGPPFRHGPSHTQPKPLRNLSANAYGSDTLYRMTRPLRLEFAGALYHVTSRGDRRGAIYRDDTDRLAWQEVLEHVCERHHFIVHSFCQMSNQYHLLVETIEANLSQGMRQLNGVYTQHFNRRHKLVGHVLQGRYKAILLQKENYLLELARTSS